MRIKVVADGFSGGLRGVIAARNNMGQVMPKILAYLIIGLCASVRDCAYIIGAAYWRIHWMIKRKF